MKNNKKSIFLPEFLMIPHQLISDPEIRPADMLVYGVVYWFSHFKEGRCTASNAQIAEILTMNTKAVGNSLLRLEEKKYIEREFFLAGKNSKERVAIHPMVFASRNKKPRSPVNPFAEEKTSSTPTVKQGKKVDKVLPTPPSNDGAPPSIKRWTPPPSNDGYPPPSNDGAPLHQMMEGKVHNDTTTSGQKEPCLRPDNEKVVKSQYPSFDGERKSNIENNRENLSVYPSGDTESIAFSGTKKETILVGVDKDTFTGKMKSQMRYENESQVPENEINLAISLFLPAYPSHFATKSPFQIPANRKAVRKALLVYTTDQLKHIITKYVEMKDDPFRPEASTIATFCNFKIDRIAAFINKKPKNQLWAQKPISTPEQSKQRDDQYAKVIEAQREKVRKAKEDWLKGNN